MTLDDAQIHTLLARARNGDIPAFTALVSELRPRVFRWALVITGDGDDADDVTQQVMIKLHGKLHDFEERSRLTTWLYTIARNTAAELMRPAFRKHEVSMEERDIPTRISDDVDKQIAKLDDQRAAAIVRSFFAELPARQRELLELIDTEGCTIVEAAGMMGIEPETGRGHLMQARRLIRSRMLALHPELIS